MKIINFLFAGLVNAHSGDGHELSAEERFNRAFDLLDAWVVDNVPDWKRQSKLTNKIDWMHHRLTHNLNEDCRTDPTEEELDELDHVIGYKFRFFYQNFDF